MSCEQCGGPLPCDCWKMPLSPARRIALQDIIVARYMAKLDALAFTRKQAQRPAAEALIRGQFGNKKARRRTA